MMASRIAMHDILKKVPRGRLPSQVAGCEETIHAKDASPLVKLTLKAAPREDLSIMRVFMLGCVGPLVDLC